ncbi:LLM class flavin-dependent oxidoreductase [Pelistega suis]|uniref:LLM class flavin-dependent oxidoreductase n=1 Tax=Pelistega suis TaxID=1631957 RepID=UPI00211B78FC|nr:LLM class flavin-dependent oxidoreductase [Pelistega suis]MCQ9327936.1 LLM class flavin-dependent oxidoreductase [Pelistega suis]
MKLSILNLVPLREGQDYRQAIESMVSLAKLAESLGVERYWIAEHHNMPNLASSATQLLIQHTLANTSTLKVGSGGVMLPNHAPYLVAEQYGTLATLYPGRVQLGLGRAPGTDMRTARALRRGAIHPEFIDDLLELRGYFENTNPVSAYPAAGLEIPFYILGSSTDSAYLAAELGLPYAFASHFAPEMMEEAVAIYRRLFKPSKHLEKPYVILGANAILADTHEQAQQLATTYMLFALGILRNARRKLHEPFASIEELWETFSVSPQEQAWLAQRSEYAFIGTPATVAFRLEQLQKQVEFDELMAVSYIFDEEKQHYSYSLLKNVVDGLS